jgi:Trk K+ transport system NAD-binding subunit
VRLIDPTALRVRALSDHVVLGGAGRLSLLYIRKLRETDPRRTVVVVERESSHPLFAELRGLPRVLIINGDIASDQALEGLRLQAAHRVLLLTGDDFANLDAAAKMLRVAPALAGRIVVHVSDLGLMRETARSSVARDCGVFNGHEFAAMHLVREHLIKRFRSTPERDLVVLAGFGRFGQTVLHQLQQHTLGSFGKVVILDEIGTRNVRAFQEEPGFSDDYELVVIDGDLRDPEIWRCIGDEIRDHGPEPVIVMGSGDDGTNLHAALRAAKRHPKAYVIVRMFRSSPFTTEVAEEAGTHAVNLRELIRSGMPENWF